VAVLWGERLFKGVRKQYKEATVMRRVISVLAILTMVLLVTNALSAQGRGQGGRPAGVGAPSTSSIPGNRPSNPGQSTDRGSANSGKPEITGKSADHQPESSRAADPTDTHGFKNYGQYMAATHVAENLQINIDRLKIEMVDNKLSLGKAIATLRPELSSQTIEVEVKKAEASAKKAEAEAKKGKPNG
jgi:hypothetical protein